MTVEELYAFAHVDVSEWLLVSLFLVLSADERTGTHGKSLGGSSCSLSLLDMGMSDITGNYINMGKSI